jgi:hypothetical protein
MQSGQRVHVLIEWGQDMEVWEAVKQAWAERGVQAETFEYWEVMGISKEEFEMSAEANAVYGNDGWKELGVFEPQYKAFFPEDIRESFGGAASSRVIRPLMADFLDRHPDIQFLYIFGGGGGSGVQDVPRHAEKYQGNWALRTKSDLLAKSAEFPPDVWNLVAEKIIRPIPFVSEGTIEDPEGTNLHWDVTPDQARHWSRSTGSTNHVYIYPSPIHSTFRPGGVIRAHGNHTGIFPTMSVYLNEHGSVERVEKGGKTGDLFRMLVNHPVLREANFPKAPGPGYWFLRQDGLATNPKFPRNMELLTQGAQALANGPERNRAGIQHLAFSYSSNDPADLAYASEKGIPLGIAHTAHMHAYFPTVRWQLRDTGEWITISEKGHLNAFEDPEVRALAAQYGDPDLIFRYEWIPSLPGINTPGDYEKDYAPDPWSWIMDEWERIQAGTYEYFVEDYSLEANLELDVERR